jgi:hypothetical protein
MVRLPDSRTASRVLAALGLVVGPLMFLCDTVIDPAWAEDHSAYLAEIAGSKAAYVAAEVIATIGALLLIAGLLGVMRLLRGPRITPGQLAATVLIVGLIGIAGSLAFSVFGLAMTDFQDRDAMIALHEELEDSNGYAYFWLAFFTVGVVLGSIALALAIARSHLVPLWSPALLATAAALWLLAGQNRLLNGLTFLILTAALAPLARHIWLLSNEDWGRWVPADGDQPLPRSPR